MNLSLVVAWLLAAAAAVGIALLARVILRFQRLRKAVIADAAAATAAQLDAVYSCIERLSEAPPNGFLIVRANRTVSDERRVIPLPREVPGFPWGYLLAVGCNSPEFDPIFQARIGASAAWIGPGMAELSALPHADGQHRADPRRPAAHARIPKRHFLSIRMRSAPRADGAGVPERLSAVAHLRSRATR